MGGACDDVYLGYLRDIAYHAKTKDEAQRAIDMIERNLDRMEREGFVSAEAMATRGGDDEHQG